MATLVTVAELKSMLKIDGDEQNGVLHLYAQSASNVILRYLGARAAFYITVDENGAYVSVPPEVKHAVALLVGHFTLHPDEDPEQVFGHGHLPWFVTGLLYQMRDPALA